MWAGIYTSYHLPIMGHKGILIPACKSNHMWNCTHGIFIISYYYCICYFMVMNSSWPLDSWTYTCVGQGTGSSLIHIYIYFLYLCLFMGGTRRPCMVTPIKYSNFNIIYWIMGLYLMKTHSINCCCFMFIKMPFNNKYSVGIFFNSKSFIREIMKRKQTWK